MTSAYSYKLVYFLTAIKKSDFNAYILSKNGGKVMVIDVLMI